MKNKVLKYALIGAMLIPAIAGAQQVGGNINAIFDLISSLITRAVPLLVTLALAAFIWGLIKFVINESDGEAREEGKRMMWWGIVALFVIVSIWGITKYIRDTIGITGENTVVAPKVVN